MVRKLALIAIAGLAIAAGAQAKVSAERALLAPSSERVGGVSTEAVTVQYRSTPSGSVYYFGGDFGTDTEWVVPRGLDDGKFTTNEARLITGAVFPVKTLARGGGTVDVTLAFYDTLDLPTAANPVVEPVTKDFLGSATFRINQAPGAFAAYNAAFASPILFPDQDFVVDFICTDPENGEVVDWATAFTLTTQMPSVGTTTDDNGWPGWWDNDFAGPVKGVFPLQPDTPDNEWMNSNTVFGDPIRGASYFRLLGGLASDRSIPEPGTFALLGAGLLPLLGLRRRK